VVAAARGLANQSDNENLHDGKDERSSQLGAPKAQDSKLRMSVQAQVAIIVS
jgi:hypothetical protein